MKTSSIHSVLIVLSIVGLVSGQKAAGFRTLRTCSNTTDTFHICWSHTNTNITYFCIYLKNFINFVSEDVLISEKNMEEYDHTFLNLQLGFEYSGCVIPIVDPAAFQIYGNESDTEGEADCKNIRKEFGDENATCLQFTAEGWTFRESLAVACTVYLLVMYVSLRLANIFCPHERKTTPLDFEKFYLYNERKHLKKSKAQRSDTVKKRVDSIKEKARRRSDAVLVAMSKSPTTPVSQSSETETDFTC